MTDGYLRGAVRQYKASKKIFLGGKTPLSSKPRDLQIYFEINKNGG